MTSSLKELRSLSSEDLIKKHDQLARTTSHSVNYYLQELARRDQNAQTEVMLKLTRWITWMTAVITLATIVNLILAFF
ncbi:MAG: hypothetical protein R6W69_04490 [Anaerolineales bacterium]